MEMNSALSPYHLSLGRRPARIARMAPLAAPSGDKLMKQSILTFALALGLSAGLGAAAYADQTDPTPQPVPQQTAQAAQSAAADVDPYAASLNRSYASPYDYADAFTMPDGNPAPGWKQMLDLK
jgi:hypothetical protein